MIFRIAFALLAAVSLAACAGPPRDSPQACAFARKAAFSVRFVHGLPLTDAFIDGTPATLLVDTGSTDSLVGRDAAERLKLRTDFTKVSGIAGIGGTSFEHPVTISRLAIGDLTIPERSLIVGPFAMPDLDGIRPDGILGNDIMARFDVDLDLPHRRVTLYTARNCPSGVPPWQERFTRVPTPEAAPGRALAFVPAVLDNHSALAILDSGATFTAVDRRFAIGSGTAQASLDADFGGAVSGAWVSRAAIRLHRFTTASIGAERLATTRFVVTDLPQDMADMIIGEDFLRTRRVWISYLSRMVYIGAPARHQLESPSATPDADPAAQ
jgi:Aspartyl protease